MNEFVEKVSNDEVQARHVTIRENHTAVAQVGKDTIDAEYFVFEHSDWWPSKHPETLMDKLEDLWYTITWPLRKIRWWLKDLHWDVHYGLQRMFRGYDEVDTFETFAKFIERYSKILTDYRKHHIGYCGEMTEEEWDATIDEMIYHLKYMDEETVIDELENDVPENWSVSAKTVSEVLDSHKDRFFELFSKYFYNLWD